MKAIRHGLSQREVNTESGLMDYRARSLDPRTGRFLEPEPILGIRPYQHYSYAKNNPVTHVDPDGRRTYVRVDDAAKTVRVISRIFVTSADNDLNQADDTAKKLSLAINKFWNNEGFGWTVRFRTTAGVRENYKLTFEPDIWYGYPKDSNRPELTEFDRFQYGASFSARTSHEKDWTVANAWPSEGEFAVQAEDPTRGGEPSHLC